MREEWTEKYRPKTLRDIVGNEAAVRSIIHWAESWEGGAPRKKALVLLGEPGTGKTSSALAIASDMGWDFIEMNASDHRNAASIESVAGAGSSTQTFSASGEFLSTSRGKRKLIILDEADSLFGNEDRGGAKAIVETVRNSCQPIVLIVNDYHELTRKSPAIKTLADRATFRRLGREEVTRVLRAILEKECIDSPKDVLDSIALNAEGDLRAAINDLQMIVEGRTTLERGDSGVLGKRNQEKELQVALRSVFRASGVREARDATFDLDLNPEELIPWIEEGIPVEMRSTQELADAFDAASKADIYLGRTWKHKHYGLWSYAKELMTGGVALSRTQKPPSTSIEYGFPGRYIVMSRAKGPRGAREAVSGKLAAHYHTSKKCVEESTLALLSSTVQRDEELLVYLGHELEFGDSDVAYLLREEPDSPRVARVMARILAGATVEEEPQVTGKPKRSRGKGRLVDF